MAAMHTANKLPAGESRLLDIFHEADGNIERKRTENLFKELDSRSLTTQEEDIIQQRVQLQRKLLEEYEKREKQRKIREVLNVCPDLSEATAERALSLCNGREDEATLQLASDPAFKRRCMLDTGYAVLTEQRPRNSNAVAARRPAVASNGPRPKLISPSKMTGVFVGRFQGRLGPHQQKALQEGPAAPPAAAAAQATARKSKNTKRAKSAAQSEQQMNGEPSNAGGGASAAAEASSPATQASARLRKDATAAAALVDGAGVKAGAATDEEATESEPEDEETAGATASADENVEAPGNVMEWVEQDGADGVGDAQTAAAASGGSAETAALTPKPASRALLNKAKHLADMKEVELALEELVSMSAGSREQLFVALQQVDAARCQKLRVAWETFQAVAAVDGAEAAAEAVAVTAAAAASPGSLARRRVDAHRGSSNAATAAGDADAPAAVALTSEMVASAAAPAPAGAPAEESAWHTKGAGKPATAAGGRTKKLVSGKLSVSKRAKQSSIAGFLSHSDGRAAPVRAAAAATAGAAETPLLAASGASPQGAGSGPAPAAPAALVGHEEPQLQSNAVNPTTDAATKAHAHEETAAPAAASAAMGTPRAPGGAVGGGAVDGDAVVTSDKLAAAPSSQDRQPARSSKRARKAPTPQHDAGAPSGLAPPAAAGQQDPAASPSNAASPAKRARRSSSSNGATPASPTATAAPLATEADAAEAAAGGAAEADGPSTEGRPGRRRRAGAAAAPTGAAGDDSATNIPHQPRGPGGTRAINPVTGHTVRGRVRQKSGKRADMEEVGELRLGKGWCNAGYIFPDGFKSRLLFRSSVDIGALCVHECEIIGSGGHYWPEPTFRVVALDRPDDPLIARSCTGCWSAVLKRINAEIEGRRAAGEDLPPPPKTAIAGPEYFGLNQADVIAAIEALDPDKLCEQYWAGKEDRSAVMAGMPIRAPPPATATTEGGVVRERKSAVAAGGSGGAGRRAGGKRGRSRAGGDEDGGSDDEGGDEGYHGNRWSAIGRSERYRKRCEEAGDDAAPPDDQNPLPGFIDPITMESVVNPAISPYGHVMGLATWRAVLAEQHRCPFTKNPLAVEQLTVLTPLNIERHRDRILQQ